MENLEQKQKVLKKLREWREKEATREGVELFRILSNDAVNGIVETLPTTKDALLEVKGIAEKKYQKYGREILSLVGSVVNTNLFEIEKKEEKEEPDGQTDGYRQNGERVFSVSDYLDLLNVGLRDFEAKVVGEISSLDIRGNYIFFGLKDKDGSTLKCFMWASNYRMSGVELSEGLEILAHGFPKIHKPSGQISFEANAVELVGEGALKKAYDELKKKLEKEGLFSEARKKTIPEYPHKIGLITSSTGAVIHDFLNNIGKFGFHISFRDSRVEGALAVKELISSVRYFKKKNNIDVLVIIRGGGSLESLQAFNNETLVREIADCPFPVMVGIGHDKDVPIVSLVADKAGSTPTAVAKALNFSWEQALSKVRLAEQKIMNRFGTVLHEKRETLRDVSGNIERRFRTLFERFRIAEERLKRSAVSIGNALLRSHEIIVRSQKTLLEKLGNDIRREKEKLVSAWKLIEVNNPERQLKLGYSLAFSKGRVIRSVGDVKSGEEITIKVGDGNIEARVD